MLRQFIRLVNVVKVPAIYIVNKGVSEYIRVPAPHVNRGSRHGHAQVEISDQAECDSTIIDGRTSSAHRIISSMKSKIMVESAFYLREGSGRTSIALTKG